MDGLKRFLSFFLSRPFWIFFAGILFFFGGAFISYFEVHPNWQMVLMKIGEILLISVLFSFLTNSIEFIGVFQDLLEKVIYDAKFLKKRKDISKIWETVSKEMFKSKFPKISRPLLEIIKKDYLSQDEVSYYSDYRNIYDVKFDDADRNFIIVNNDVSFVLNAVNENEFSFPIKNWICASDATKDNVDFEIKSVTVNNNPVVPKLVKKEYKDGCLFFHYEIKLKGCKEYSIKQNIKKRYSIKEDNYIAFKAKWLVNNMTVQLFHPKEFNVLFVERATSEKFNIVKKREDYLEYEYKGLILRSQGYIMIFNPKND